MHFQVDVREYHLECRAEFRHYLNTCLVYMVPENHELKQII